MLQKILWPIRKRSAKTALPVLALLMWWVPRLRNPLWSTPLKTRWPILRQSVKTQSLIPVLWIYGNPPRAIQGWSFFFRLKLARISNRSQGGDDPRFLHRTWTRETGKLSRVSRYWGRWRTWNISTNRYCFIALQISDHYLAAVATMQWLPPPQLFIALMKETIIGVSVITIADRYRRQLVNICPKDMVKNNFPNPNRCGCAERSEAHQSRAMHLLKQGNYLHLDPKR